MFEYCKYTQTLVLNAIVLALLPIATGHLNVHLEPDGSYYMFVNQQKWLTSGPTFFRSNGSLYSTADGSLKQIGGPRAISGKDTLGDWKGQMLLYTANKAKVSVSIHIYDSDCGQLAIFTQSFTDEFKSTSTSDANGVISGFPSFAVGKTSAELGYLAYNGVFAGWLASATGRWTHDLPKLGGGLQAGPLLIFDQNSSVLVISSFDNFMAASYEHAVVNSTVSWGIMGKVDSIPQGFQYSTIMYYSADGINKAMMSWGQTIRKWYGRDEIADRQLDISNDYIGYYTDNGAYYYQVPEKGLNFEQTLLEVDKFAKYNNLPYRYLQYDDWFYKVVGPTQYGAVVTWDAMPSIFPHGMQYMYNVTRLPVVAHNRYWSDTTPYAKQNGGPFNFIFDGHGNALPDDQSFWDFLLSRAKLWGLVTYEQDWLNYQVEDIDAVHSDLSLGTRWLTQMGDAARRYGLTVQYCMALPRHVMSAVRIPAVTQVRASIDYHLDPHQYQIGLSSLFVHALGLVPFKDNFWTTRVQPGNRYNKTEDNPKLQAVVSLLSTGPVGVGDRVGYTDVDLVHRLSTSNGLLLQPSRPATAIDVQILQAAFGGNIGPKGQVWTTESIISGLLFGVIFAAELKEPYHLLYNQTGFDSKFNASYVYPSEHLMGSWQAKPFDVDNSVWLDSCGSYTSTCLYHTSPLLSAPDGGRFFLAGELDKLLPMSPRRVRSVSVSGSDTTVQLVGSPGELVHFDVCRLTAAGGHCDGDFDYCNAVQCSTVTCKITGGGTARLSVMHSSCY